MNPDVVGAIGLLRDRDILSEPQAARFLRVARRELVSVRMELRVLLYGGVLLLASGVGLFLRENHERIGPALIACLTGAAAAACFLYVLRRSPSFSWGPTQSPHLAADYILLLGVLLLASDLAYVEAQFRVLGPRWPYHLLLVSLVSFAAAYRFDNRGVLSLALTSFAAWRGVESNFPFRTLLGDTSAVISANALLCGVIFLFGALVSIRLRKKGHFEPVWGTFGFLLLFGGLVSEALGNNPPAWHVWEVILGSCAAVTIPITYRRRRSLYFAIAVIATYLGSLRILWKTAGSSETVFFTFVTFSSVAVVFLLFFAHRRMKAAP